MLQFWTADSGFRLCGPPSVLQCGLFNQWHPIPDDHGTDDDDDGDKNDNEDTDHGGVIDDDDDDAVVGVSDDDCDNGGTMHTCLRRTDPQAFGLLVMEFREQPLGTGIP